MQKRLQSLGRAVVCNIMLIARDPARATAEIGEAVRGARREQGLRQEELALAAGISTKTLHNVESGTSGMRIDTVLRLLRVLGLGLEIIARAPSAPRRPEHRAPTGEPEPEA